MITFVYRWKIPQELKEEFLKNWVEHNACIQEQLGAYLATLYECGDDYVSETHWPDEESWSWWEEYVKNNPCQNQWEEYRVSGPDKLVAVTRIGDAL